MSDSGKIIHKPELSDDYVQAPGIIIRDNELPMTARVIMVYLWGRSTGWGVSSEAIRSHLGINDKQTVANHLKQLENRGYLKRARRRDEGGKVKGGYDYELCIPDDETSPLSVSYRERDDSTSNHKNKKSPAKKQKHYGFIKKNKKINKKQKKDDDETDHADHDIVGTATPGIEQSQSNQDNEFSPRRQTDSDEVEFKRRPKKPDNNAPPKHAHDSEFVNLWNEWVNRHNPTQDEMARNSDRLSKHLLPKAKEILQHQIPANDAEIEVASIIVSGYQGIIKREPDKKDIETASIIARSMIKWWNKNITGSKTAIGSPKFYLPSPEKLAEEYVKYLNDNFGSWTQMPIHAIKTSTKVWRNFLSTLEQKLPIGGSDAQPKSNLFQKES